MIKSINCNYCHFVRKYPNIFPTHSRFTHSISSLIPTEGQRINVKCRPLNYMFNSTAHLAKDGILSICDYLRHPLRRLPEVLMPHQTIEQETSHFNRGLSKNAPGDPLEEQEKNSRLISTSSKVYTTIDLVLIKKFEASRIMQRLHGWISFLSLVRWKKQAHFHLSEGLLSLSI